MLKVLKNAYSRIIDVLIIRPEGMSKQDIRMLSLCRIGTPIGLCVHLCLQIWLMSLGQIEVAIFNGISILVWIYALWLVFSKSEFVVPVISTFFVQMPLYTLVGTYYLGIEIGVDAILFISIGYLSFAHFMSLGFRVLGLVCFVFIYAALQVYSLNYLPVSPVPHHWLEIGSAIIHSMTVISVFILCSVFMIAVRDAETRAQSEYDRAEGLLLNILPSSIAARLKASRSTIADEFPSVTILFADIVGFTQSSENRTAKQVVDELNHIFTEFDQLAEARGVEKIKTIGDAYMAVCGLPDPRPDHAETIVEFAKDMLEKLEEVNRDLKEPVKMRIGINTGPVVAGVIGQSKFAYDLWGDAVNMASRMEQLAGPNEMRLSEATYNAVRQEFNCTDMGVSNVKGKGNVRTFSV